MKNPAAFPVCVPAGMNEVNEGMLLRDFFAAAAMGALIQRARPGFPIGEAAYDAADSMMQARAKWEKEAARVAEQQVRQEPRPTTETTEEAQS